MTTDDPTPIHVYVCDPKHPHFGEHGVMTGKIITMRFGAKEPMAEVRLLDCKHGTEGCFVSKGQIAADKRGMR